MISSARSSSGRLPSGRMVARRLPQTQLLWTKPELWKLPRMRMLVVLLVVTSCEGKAPELEVDPVTDEQATAFANEFVKAAMPCDRENVQKLIDDKALVTRFQQHGPSSLSTSAAAMQLEKDHIGSKVVCSSQAKAEDYKVLRVR